METHLQSVDGMDQELVEQARLSRYFVGDLRLLAGKLPADDAALDALLGRLVEQGDELAFTHCLLAALDAEREVDAQHLVRGTALLPGPGRRISQSVPVPSRNGNCCTPRRLSPSLSIRMTALNFKSVPRT